MSDKTYLFSKRVSSYSPPPMGPPPYIVPLNNLTGLTGADGKLVKTMCWPKISFRVGPDATSVPDEVWWGEDMVYFIATLDPDGRGFHPGDLLSGWTVLHAQLTAQLMPSQSDPTAYQMVYSCPPGGLLSKISRRGSSDTVESVLHTGFYVGSQFLNTIEFTNLQISACSLDTCYWEVSPRP